MPVLDEALLTRPQRLAAVARAHRTLPSAVVPLNAVARLAADLAKAPTGVICLVGEEDETVLGGSGVPAPLGVGQHLRRQQSVSPYVVSANQPIAVADMVTDPTLRRHPLTVEHGVRSFAGVPLRDADDQPVGSLTVIDTRARDWSGTEVATLVKVAEIVGTVPAAGSSGTDLDPATMTALAGLDSVTLVNSLPVAFTATDTVGRIIGWNPAATDAFGWSAAEAIGQRLDQLLLIDPGPEEYIRQITERFHAPFGQPRVIHGVARRRDGGRFDYEAVVVPLPSQTGPMLCGFLLDVSRRQHAERIADEREKFLAAVLDSVLPEVAACDSTGRLVLLNRTTRETYRLPETWTAEELAPGWRSLAYADGTPMPREETPLIRALHGQQIRAMDLRVRQPGRDRLYAVNAQPIVGSDGRRLGAVAALHDITDERRAEQFRACELDVVKALTYAEDIGTAGRLVLKAICRTLGWPYAELWLVDELAGVLRPASSWTDAGSGIDLAHGSLKPAEGLAGTVWSENQPRWLPDLAEAEDLDFAQATTRCGLRAALGLPIRGGEAVQGVLVLFADTVDEPPRPVMTLLSAMGAHLGAYLARQYARGLALELGRSRDDFLSLAGHAMRTPLTSIASYTDLLLSQETGLSEQDRHMLTVIARHTDSLRRIIDDLLELASLQSGVMTIQRYRVDVVPLIRDAVAAAAELAAANRVEITTELPDTLALDADPGRLTRVVDNLLANAVKYSPDGGTITIRLAMADGVAELTVSDCGVGVPVDEREQLFRRFFRARNVLERGIAGSGLGLTTARAIVEAHDGQIFIAPRPDNQSGTVVTVRLPLRYGEH